MAIVKQHAQAAGELTQARPAQTLKDVIEDNWQRIAAVAPRHLNPDRLLQIAISTINTTPKLAEASPASLLSCLMRCSALGLEPSAVDGLGMAYILPFYNSKTRRTEATFILGYKGMVELARRSGDLIDIYAYPVYKGDEFEVTFGLSRDIKHVPTDKSPKTAENLTHVYMVARFKDGGYHFEVMTKDEVDAIRKRSKAADRGPWVSDYVAMALKTVVRKGFKYLPVSVEARTAAETDETTGGFENVFTPDIIPMPEEAADTEDAPHQIEGEDEVIEAEVVEEKKPAKSKTKAKKDPEPEVEVDESETPQEAVCGNCGDTMTVAPDVLESDLEGEPCACGEPDWKLA